MRLRDKVQVEKLTTSVMFVGIFQTTLDVKNNDTFTLIYYFKQFKVNCQKCINKVYL